VRSHAVNGGLCVRVRCRRRQQALKQKQFSDFMIDGVKCGPDGVRCDVNGNVWASSNAGRRVGCRGARVFDRDKRV
jgi:sugar lactone lactonase YvrE